MRFLIIVILFSIVPAQPASANRANLIKGAYSLIKGAVTSKGIRPAKELVKTNRKKVVPAKQRYRNADGSLSKPMTKPQRKAALKRRKTGHKITDNKTVQGTGLVVLGAAVGGASEGAASVITEKVIDKVGLFLPKEKK